MLNLNRLRLTSRQIRLGADRLGVARVARVDRVVRVVRAAGPARRIRNTAARLVLAGALAAASAILASGCGLSVHGQRAGDERDPASAASAPGSGLPGAASTGSNTGDHDGSTVGESTPVGTNTTAKGAGEVTLRGAMEDGVEGGCLVFRADNGQIYQLIGDDVTTIGAGLRVEITGKPAVGVATSCQQGAAFLVSHARLL